MILNQSLIWIVLFPLAVFSYLFVTFVQLIIFLFNCPVDIWNIIGNGLHQSQSDRKNKQQ